jgi:hypothetical protein
LRIALVWALAARATDGSGRFDGAHGELDAIVHVGSGTFVPDDGAIWMVSPYESTVTGYITS